MTNALEALNDQNFGVDRTANCVGGIVVRDTALNRDAQGAAFLELVSIE